MLDLDTRTAILKLAEQGHGPRTISRTLRLSRNAVRRVLRSGQAVVPRLERDEQLAPHLERIRDLYVTCEGNRVRVVEKLAALGVEVGYSSLTAFCRRHGIGTKPPRVAGQYSFGPGEEMQHDTSPHTVPVGGVRRLLHCASCVLCYSRRIYAQLYPRWSRFECKVFFTEALQTFEGAAGRCIVDNSSVILHHGSGADAVVAAEMEAFAQRFGFRFEAHAKGDANRSARVERPFDYIERNFYPGRTFADLDDLNAQLRAWCDAANRRPKRSLGTTPWELYLAERPALRPLPAHIPEVYAPHTRRVDVDGYVSLHRNRYSVPATLVGRSVDIRESIERVRVFDGHALVADHRRLEPGLGKIVRLDEHHAPWRLKAPARVKPLPEEITLRAADPMLAALVDRLRRRYGGQAARAVRELHRLYLDYPTETLVATIAIALQYDLIDLARIERMVLRRIAGDYFRLPLDPGDGGSDE